MADKTPVDMTLGMGYSDQPTAPDPSAGQQSVTLPDVFVSPDDDKPKQTNLRQQGFSQNYTLATGGALDLGGYPDQIAPIDQASGAKIGDHSQVGGDDAAVAPISGPMPKIPQMDQVPQPVRDNYTQQLTEGQISDPHDFAEQFTGTAWAAAHSQTDDPTEGTQAATAAKITNAAQALGNALPHPADVSAVADHIMGDVYGLTRQRDNPEQMFTPEENAARNKPWSTSGNYQTNLAPGQEADFEKWVKDNKIPFDLTEAKPDYDMRGFWQAHRDGDPNASTAVDPHDKQIHFPDRWKTPYSPTFSAQSQYATKGAPDWNGDRYGFPNGYTIYDDDKGRWFGMPGDKPPTTQTMHAGIAGNLLEAWRETGVSVLKLAQMAQDPRIAKALATPPPAQSPHMPTPEELHQNELPLRPMFGGQMNSWDPTGVWKTLGDLVDLPGTEFDHTQKIKAMQAAGADPEAIMREKMESPTLKLLAGLVAGKAIGMGMEGLGDGSIAATLKALANDESGELKTKLQGQVPGAMAADLIGKYFPFPATRFPEWSNPTKALITEHALGWARAMQAQAVNIVEGFRTEINKGRPAFRQYRQELSAYAQARASAMENWVDAGNDKAKFRDADHGLTQPAMNDIQAVYDHVEDRPGGGRIAPDHPLFPLVENIRGIMTTLRTEIEKTYPDMASFVDDYVSHIYEDPSAFARAYGGPARSGNASYLRARSIPYIFDAMLKGLRLKYDDPLDTILHYVNGMSNHLARQRILREMDDAGVMQWGRDAPFDGWQKLVDVRRKPIQPEREPGSPGTEPVGKQKQISDINPEMANKIEGPTQTLLPSSKGAVVSAETPTGGRAQLSHDELRLLPGPQQAAADAAAAGGTKATQTPWQGVDEEFGWAHPSIASPYNSHYGTGWNRWSGAPVLNGLQFGMNMMTAWKIGLPLAHAGQMAIESAAQGLASGWGAMMRGDVAYGLKQMGMGFVMQPQYKLGADLQKIYLGTKENMSVYEQRIAKALIDAGARPLGRSQEYAIGQSKNLWTAARQGGIAERLREEFIKAGTDDKLGNVVSGTLRLMGDVMHTISSPLFDDIIPKLKAGAVYQNIIDDLRANPMMSHEELVNRIGGHIDSVDKRLGEMDLERIWVPRAAKQMASLALLSTSWTYGTLSALGRGVNDMLHLRNSSYSKYIVAMPMVHAMVSSIYQSVMTAAHGNFQYPGAGGWKDFLFPQNGQPPMQSGQPSRDRMLSPLKEAWDLYDLAFNAWHSPDLANGLKQGALSYVFSKTKPAIKGFWDYMSGTTSQDTINAVKNAVTPIGIQQAKGFDPEALIKGALGFSPAPRQFSDPDSFGQMLNNVAAKKVYDQAYSAWKKDQDNGGTAGIEKPDKKAIYDQYGGVTQQSTRSRGLDVRPASKPARPPAITYRRPKDQ